MATTKIRGSTQIIAGSIPASALQSGSAITPDGATAFSANQSMGGFKLTNLGTPTTGTDAATKTYVDDIASGLDVKQSVRVATTANITLSGEQTIDGVSVIAGNRVLVKNQSTGSENGLYVCASGAWSRSTDADADAEVTAGMFVFVEEGTANGDQGWVLTTNNPIVVGTTSLTFAQFSSSASLVAGAGLLQTGNTFDVVAGDQSLLVNADELHVQLQDASLETVSGGLRVKHGTSGQIYVANASGVLTPVTMSGDATAVASGAVTVNPATVVKTANVVTRETPSGTINGSNVTFTLAFTPVAGTEHVYLNGLLQTDSGADYSISGATITFVSAPQTGDVLRVSYLK